MKSDIYGLSDWMARQVYADSINFFYTDENIRPEAFANLYAEKMEKWADSMFLMGKGEEASRILERAAKLRLRFASTETEIPEENFFVWMDIGDLLYLNTHNGLLF